MCIRRLFQSFRNVRWTGALQVEDYQRLRLRLLGLEMAVFALAFLGTLLFVLGTRLPMPLWAANTLFAALALTVLLAVPLMLVVIAQIIKIDLARLRDFNIPTCRVVGILVAAFAALFALGVADARHGTNLTLWYGLAWTVAYALYTYYVFFGVPQRPTRYPVSVPFAAPQGRNERILQFIFQIGVWFNIFYEPLSYAFQH